MRLWNFQNIPKNVLFYEILGNKINVFGSKSTIRNKKIKIHCLKKNCINEIGNILAPFHEILIFCYEKKFCQNFLSNFKNCETQYCSIFCDEKGIIKCQNSFKVFFFRLEM